jgi:hypothetical protein
MADQKTKTDTAPASAQPVAQVLDPSSTSGQPSASGQKDATSTASKIKIRDIDANDLGFKVLYQPPEIDDIELE